MMNMALSHDAWETYFLDKQHPPLICPHCRATVKRFIHHCAEGWVPVWRCKNHGDVIPTEKGLKQ